MSNLFDKCQHCGTKFRAPKADPIGPTCRKKHWGDTETLSDKWHKLSYKTQYEIATHPHQDKKILKAIIKSTNDILVKNAAEKNLINQNLISLVNELEEDRVKKITDEMEDFRANWDAETEESDDWGNAYWLDQYTKNRDEAIEKAKDLGLTIYEAPQAYEDVIPSLILTCNTTPPSPRAMAMFDEMGITPTTMNNVSMEDYLKHKLYPDSDISEILDKFIDYGITDADTTCYLTDTFKKIPSSTHEYGTRIMGLEYFEQLEDIANSEYFKDLPDGDTLRSMMNGKIDNVIGFQGQASKDKMEIYNNLKKYFDAKPRNINEEAVDNFVKNTSIESFGSINGLMNTKSEDDAKHKFASNNEKSIGNKKYKYQFLYHNITKKAHEVSAKYIDKDPTDFLEYQAKLSQIGDVEGNLIYTDKFWNEKNPNKLDRAFQKVPKLNKKLEDNLANNIPPSAWSNEDLAFALTKKDVSPKLTEEFYNRASDNDKEKFLKNIHLHASPTSKILGDAVKLMQNKDVSPRFLDAIVKNQKIMTGSDSLAFKSELQKRIQLEEQKAKKSQSLIYLNKLKEIDSKFVISSNSFKSSDILGVIKN